MSKRRPAWVKRASPDTKFAARIHRRERRVCGKPHRTMKAAERGKRAAELNGWDDVEIETRCGGEYYVVTGVIPFRRALEEVAGVKPGVSKPGLKGRYRWQGPP